MRFQDYRTFYHLRRKRNNSPADYFEFEEFQGKLLADYLKSRAVLFDDCQTLDLACGLGGYIPPLQASGARVVAVDFTVPHQVESFPFAISDALRVPFPNDCFDLVICTNLIEHVPDPAALLREIWRVLKPRGVVYLSYPPYYSPKGGHHFSPFHIFGERFALWVARRRGLFKKEKWLQERFPTNPTSFATAYGTWGLYKLTIARVNREIRRLPFEVLERSTRWMPIDFSGIPILGEFLTIHVQFLLRKR
ncbi:MAG: class I SAM-dependent methyltransferase [Anaerolineae bacterium]|nr:class I SAM-dependent methyltransferase [Anaerolineae bacterium]